MAGKKITEAHAEFRPNTFGDAARAIFEDTHHNYNTTKNVGKLRGYVTEQLFDHVKKGHRNRWSLSNFGDTSFELVEVEADPSVVQMRVFNISKDQPDVAFAQVTVRVVSQQRVTGEFTLPQRKNEKGGELGERKGKAAGKGRGAGKGKGKGTGGGSRVGEGGGDEGGDGGDGSGADGSDGRTPRVDTEPDDVGWVHTEPELIAEAEAGSDDGALYRLVNHCVFERPLFSAGASSQDTQWRICRL